MNELSSFAVVIVSMRWNHDSGAVARITSPTIIIAAKPASFRRLLTTMYAASATSPTSAPREDVPITADRIKAMAPPPISLTTRISDCITRYRTSGSTTSRPAAS